MKISEVKTAFKIADVEFIAGSTKLNFNYLRNLKDENGKNLPQNILTQNVARVYLIVVNGEIKKIGGSQAEGGIKSTLSNYKDTEPKGRAGIRSVGIANFLSQTLRNGDKIEIYMIYQENFINNIKGLFNTKKQESYISYKLLEKRCLEDYKSKDGEYPQWNVQERGEDWSLEIKEKHAKLLQNSQSRKKKVIRKEVKLK